MSDRTTKDPENAAVRREPEAGSETPAGLESVDARLERLALATADIRPSPDLVDRIMERIDSVSEEAMDTARVPTAGIGRHLWRSGRVALAGFMAAAIACVAWSMEAEASLDEGLLTTFDVVEVEE